MNTRIKSFNLLFLTFSACLTHAGPREDTPNILIFMADDFGLGSCEPYGANTAVVRTPALARLAASGMTFDQGYVTASVCSPSRYTMLTGRYSWRTRMKFGVINNNDPLLIEPDRPTIASFLRDLGYQTGHFGKWHLGYKNEKFRDLLGDISPGPNDVGFDYHFGVPNNMDDLHKIYIENRSIYGLRSDKISPYGKSFYGKPYAGYDAPQRNEVEVMETITEKAISWLDSGDHGKPFFMYFASVAVHHPIMPSERMRGTSEGGAYGDFIHDLDYAVGQLVNALTVRGLLENTLIFFTSDNGGDIPTEPERPECLAIAAGLVINGATRGDKHQIYEGGIRVPFIVSWPRRIQAGSRTDAFVTAGDIFATISELVTGEVPHPEIAAPDSFSFAEVLQYPARPSTRPNGVFRDAQGRKAVRFGDWKYIDNYFPQAKDKKAPVELYNLADDPGEENNLAGKNPELVQSGQKLLKAIEESASSRQISVR